MGDHRPQHKPEPASHSLCQFTQRVRDLAQQPLGLLRAVGRRLRALITLGGGAEFGNQAAGEAGEMPYPRGNDNRTDHASA